MTTRALRRKIRGKILDAVVEPVEMRPGFGAGLLTTTKCTRCGRKRACGVWVRGFDHRVWVAYL